MFIAVGTSLPELAASVVAARKNQGEMALGNILGSNLFNLGMVLGATATIAPLPVSWAGEGLLACVGLAFTVVLAMMLALGRGISRVSGALLFAGYVVYVIAVVAP